MVLDQTTWAVTAPLVPEVRTGPPWGQAVMGRGRGCLWVLVMFHCLTYVVVATVKNFLAVYS